MKLLRGGKSNKDTMTTALQDTCDETLDPRPGLHPSSVPVFPWDVQVAFYTVQRLISDDPGRYFSSASHLCSSDGGNRSTPPTAAEDRHSSKMNEAALSGPFRCSRQL